MSKGRLAARTLDTEGAKQLVQDINKVLSLKGLEWEDLPALWVHHGRLFDQRLKDAARSILKDQSIPDDAHAFREFAEGLNDALGLSLSCQVFESRLGRSWKRLRTLLVALVFGFVSYIVLGGIAAGESLIMGSRVAIAFLILAALVFCLAILEGLQISLTTLRLKDLADLRHQYPRAFLLHKRVSRETDSRRFLAGRQLFVIFIVFFAAQLTIFPDMTAFPGTRLAFPLWLGIWLEPLLRLGLPGALFVLWVGQLAPQFHANKNPLSFSNIPLFPRGALALSFVAESLGVTQPADWLSRLVRQGKDIPVSAEEKYKEAVGRHGHGLIGQKRIRAVRRNDSALVSHTWFHFTSPGRNRITDRSLMVFGESPRRRVECDLLNPLLSSDDRELEIIEAEEEPHGNGWRTLPCTITLNRRTFQPGDVVHIQTSISCRASDTEHIAVRAPHEYILFRVEFCDNPSIYAITVTGWRQDELEQGVVEFFKEDLQNKLQIAADGTPFVEFMRAYPEVGTSYMLEWQVEH